MRSIHLDAGREGEDAFSQGVANKQLDAEGMHRRRGVKKTKESMEARCVISFTFPSTNWDNGHMDHLKADSTKNVFSECRKYQHHREESSKELVSGHFKANPIYSSDGGCPISVFRCFAPECGPLQ